MAKNNLVLEYSIPIQKNVEEGVTSIQGIAVDASISRNKIKYTEEELRKAAKSLVGKPILDTHNSNSVFNTLGRVVQASYSRKDKCVRFKANIMDERAQKYIDDGRITSVSIGAKCKSLEEDENEDGVYVAKGIDFLELSLVPIPGVKNATIQQAITEKFGKLDRINTVNKENTELKGDTKMEDAQIKKLVQESVTAAFESMKAEEAKKAEEVKAVTEKEELLKTIEELKAEVKTLKETAEATTTEEAEDAEEDEAEDDDEAEGEADVGEPEESAEENTDGLVIEKYKGGVSFWMMPKE